MSSILNGQAFNLLNMKTLAERLRAALAAAQISQSELSRRVGVSRSTVSLWFGGTTRELEGQNLLKTAEILGISVNWLSTGRGTMKTGTKKEIPLEGNPDYPAIPRVNINITDSAAGYEIERLDGGDAPIVFAREWYERNGFDPDELFAIQVRGAAMEPGMFEGDWIVLNRADQVPKDGAVFVIVYDREPMVRRLFRSDGQWVAASDNADKRIYRDRPLNGDSQILGRVVHKQSDRI